MFHSTEAEEERAWFYYEPFTLLCYYKSLQKQIINAYASYQYIIKSYSEKVQRKVYPITEENLRENPEVAEQNVALLKNAIELWKAATRTSDAVAPILYHYSWHCFNSFFVYTFFRWEPQHVQSHGIRVSKWSDNIEDIEVQFLKQGTFQRLIDTWTLLGASLAFSPFLPIFEDGKIEFTQNGYYVLKNSNCLSAKQLLSFDSADFERALYSAFKEKLINCPFLINSIYLPTDALKSYLTIFVASSLARYRPVLWHSILIGEKHEESKLAINSRGALFEYTSGRDVTGTGLLNQVSRLLRDIAEGKFEFKKRT